MSREGKKKIFWYRRKLRPQPLSGSPLRPSSLTSIFGMAPSPRRGEKREKKESKKMNERMKQGLERRVGGTRKGRKGGFLGEGKRGVREKGHDYGEMGKRNVGEMWSRRKGKERGNGESKSEGEQFKIL